MLILKPILQSIQQKRNQIDILKTKQVIAKNATSSAAATFRTFCSRRSYSFGHNLLSFQDIELISFALNRQQNWL